MACLSSNTTTVTLKLGSMSLKVTVVVFDLDNSYKNLLNLVKPNWKNLPLKSSYRYPELYSNQRRERMSSKQDSFFFWGGCVPFSSSFSSKYIHFTSIVYVTRIYDTSDSVSQYYLALSQLFKLRKLVWLLFSKARMQFIKAGFFNDLCVRHEFLSLYRKTFC